LSERRAAKLCRDRSALQECGGHEAVNVEIFDEKNVQIDLPFYLAVFCWSTWETAPILVPNDLGTLSVSPPHSAAGCAAPHAGIAIIISPRGQRTR